jgi:hypothetical protein
MDMLDVIRDAQGVGAVQQLGQQFGLDENQVSSALSALVPALTAGFQNNASSPQGLDGLLGAPHKLTDRSRLRRHRGRPAIRWFYQPASSLGPQPIRCDLTLTRRHVNNVFSCAGPLEDGEIVVLANTYEL